MDTTIILVVLAAVILAFIGYYMMVQKKTAKTEAPKETQAPVQK